MTRTQGQPSYSFDVKLSAGTAATTISGEFMAPNRISETTVENGVTRQLVVVGAVTESRQAPAKTWTRSATSTGEDPARTFADLEHATDVVATGNTITFQLSGAAAESLAGAPTSVEGQVVISSGLITGLLLQTATSPAVTVSAQYTKFGEKTPIALPG